MCLLGKSISVQEPNRSFKFSARANKKSRISPLLDEQSDQEDCLFAFLENHLLLHVSYAGQLVDSILDDQLPFNIFSEKWNVYLHGLKIGTTLGGSAKKKKEY